MGIWLMILLHSRFPAPIPVKAETFDLVDKETGVAIGEVNVTSDPAGGGESPQFL